MGRPCFGFVSSLQFFLQYDKLSKETGGTSEEEAQRQELLNKIRKLGHFATTKIAPKELDLDSKSDDAEPIEKRETKEPEKKVFNMWLLISSKKTKKCTKFLICFAKKNFIG